MTSASDAAMVLGLGVFLTGLFILLFVSIVGTMLSIGAIYALWAITAIGGIAGMVGAESGRSSHNHTVGFGEGYYYGSASRRRMRRMFRAERVNRR